MEDGAMEHRVTFHTMVQVPSNGPAIPGYVFKPTSMDAAATMTDFVVPVSAGVMELMEKPKQGYCYVKP